MRELRTPAGGARACARALLVAAVATGALLHGTAVRPPRAGEPLALRWARTAAGHPLRTGLALALLAFALLPPPERAAARHIPVRGPARGGGGNELR